jgi:hypothetical protein
MTPFEHLSVLISIILGMGIAHLLWSVHLLVQARARVRFHWLPLTWCALVFVSLVQWWWGSFDMRTRQDWNFFYFLFVLLRPVVAYLSAAFVLPTLEPGSPVDLRQYYFANRQWLFSLLAAGNLLDAVRRNVEGQPWSDIAVWSNLVSCALLGSLAASRGVRHHAVITLLTAALYGAFILRAALELR